MIYFTIYLMHLYVPMEMGKFYKTMHADNFNLMSKVLQVYIWRMSYNATQHMWKRKYIYQYSEDSKYLVSHTCVYIICIYVCICICMCMCIYYIYICVCIYMYISVFIAPADALTLSGSGLSMHKTNCIHSCFTVDVYSKSTIFNDFA